MERTDKLLPNAENLYTEKKSCAVFANLYILEYEFIQY